MPFYIPSSRVWESYCSASLSELSMINLLNFSYPCQCMLASHCGFKLYFPNDAEHLFTPFFAIIYFLWWNVCSDIIYLRSLSAYSIISIISWSVSTDSFFSLLWVMFFSCLITFVCMLDIVNFTLLSNVFCCFSLNTVELFLFCFVFSGAQLSYLGWAWSFGVLLLSYVRAVPDQFLI